MQYPVQHLGCYSNELRKMLSVGLFDHHEVFLPPGQFHMDSLVFRRPHDGLLSFSWPPGINPFPKMD